MTAGMTTDKSTRAQFGRTDPVFYLEHPKNYDFNMFL